jgi:hypothetical protein
LGKVTTARRNLRISIVMAAALLIVIAMLGANAMSGATSNATKSVANDASNSQNNGANDQASGCGNNAGDASQNDAGDQQPNSDAQSTVDDITNCIYGTAAFDGFYTGGVSTGIDITANQGTKVAGDQLNVGTSYYCDVKSKVTDYGLQWYKDGATPFAFGYSPDGSPSEVWLALNTSIGFVVDIHSDHDISTNDVAVSGVWGRPAAVGMPEYSGPWVRSLEQVDAHTVKAFLAFQPYSLIYPRGAFNGDLGPFDSNRSAADFNDKSALAAYAPMGVHFYTPGEYVMSFYLVSFYGASFTDGTNSVPPMDASVVSPITSVCLCVKGTSGGNDGCDGAPDAATMAAYANVVEFNELSFKFPDTPQAATINATVSYDYVPGSYNGNGGIFMHNDTWYPLTVTETVVGQAYSGTVWDVVSLGPGDMSNFTLAVEDSQGAWNMVTPIVVNGYNYCVIGSWNTTDVTHTIHLRYMYAGPDMEYRANLVTLTPDGGVVGYQLMNAVSKQWGLFNANYIA